MPDDNEVHSQVVPWFPFMRCTICDEMWPRFLAYEHWISEHGATPPYGVLMEPVPWNGHGSQ